METHSGELICWRQKHQCRFPQVTVSVQRTEEVKLPVSRKGPPIPNKVPCPAIKFLLREHSVRPGHALWLGWVLHTCWPQHLLMDRQMIRNDSVEVSLSGPSLGLWLQKIDCLHNGKKSGTSCGSRSSRLPRLPPESHGKDSRNIKGKVAQSCKGGIGGGLVCPEIPVSRWEYMEG